MKRELFFLVLLIIAGLLWQYSKKFMKEGFQEPVLTIPKPNPQPQPVSDGDPQPFAPPSTSLLAPPPGQTASVNSYPSEDPSEKKAPVKRISNTLETLNGFLKNEGPGLAKMGDPSVQLPLQTARADARRLQDEMNVLGRNPGIESSLTIKDLDQIEANMRYLQNKWRLSANSMSGAPVEGFSGFSNRSFLSRVLNFFNPREGFQDTPADTPPDDTPPADTPPADTPPADTPPADTPPDDTPPADTPPADTPPDDTPADETPADETPADTPSTSSGNITLSELNTLQTNLNATIVRLSSSGASSPLLTRRISILQNILDSVNGFLVDIESGTMVEADIPIKKVDYDMFLPFVTSRNGSQLDQPLPEIIAELGANSALSNLFPAYMNGDVSGASLAKQLFEKYAPNFLKNISYDLNLKLSHKSDSENAIAEEIATAFANSVLPAGSPAYATSDSQNGTNGSAPSGMGGADGRGELEAKTSNSLGNTITVSGNGTSGDSSKVPAGTLYSSKPTTFVWKDRANQICDQISKRGLNPDDYGCLQDPDDVDENFSYRGYARMICTRLGTNYDPSIPEVCGCPPLTWAGWRS